MKSPVLSDKEYAELKKKLHQAHDKLIKSTLHEREAIRELIDKIVSPLLKNIKIDLDALELDTTTYIRPNLQVFFSDIVYLATLVDEKTGKREAAKVAFLIEHKSQMPTELSLRLQALDYINAIMKMNYDKDSDKTIPVITIVFNQFDKDWNPQTFRSLFPAFSATITQFIPEFGYLVINLASLSESIMASLDKFGTLKAAFLAMKHVKNKRFLKQHFEKIFLFLQEHPDKTTLRDQLIAYLLGHSGISAQDLEELLANIFSPVLKQEIMLSGNGFIAVAAREAAKEAKAGAKKAADKAAEKAAKKAQLEIEKAREEIAKTRLDAEKTRLDALQLKTRLTVLHGWNRDASLDLIADMADLSPNEVRQLITSFEKVKTYCHSKIDIDIEELMQLTGLNEPELNALLGLLQRQK